MRKITLAAIAVIADDGVNTLEVRDLQRAPELASTGPR
jgi:hypothetical protein